MTSDQFVAWLEDKLKEHSVKKVVPDEVTLAAAWQRADRVSRIQDAVQEIESAKTSVFVPKDLEAKVRKLLHQKPELSWDQALVRIAARER
jgi:hypothetical protein